MFELIILETLAKFKLEVCPDRLVDGTKVGTQVTAQNEEAAKKMFEDQIDKDFEKTINLKCEGLCPKEPEAKCVFDYKVGPIKATVMVEPGETKKYKRKVDGMYACEAWVEYGCYCEKVQ